MKRDGHSPGPLCVPVERIYALGVSIPKEQVEEEPKKQPEPKLRKKKSLFGWLVARKQKQMDEELRQHGL